MEFISNLSQLKSQTFVNRTRVFSDVDTLLKQSIVN